MKIQKVYVVKSEMLGEPCYFSRSRSAQHVAEEYAGNVEEKSLIVFETIQEFHEWKRNKK